jgi:Uma2 family endonuclease
LEVLVNGHGYNGKITYPSVKGGVMPLTQRRADRVVLHNISWQQFENLLADLGESRAARVAYDDGTLEIMTPLPEHEYYKEVIGDSIKEIAEVLDQDYESLGSTTWKREIKKAEVEPDNCFYFQNEPKIRGKLEYDLNQDPPPDVTAHRNCVAVLQMRPIDRLS